MTPERAAVCRRVLQWRVLCETWAPRFQLDPWLVLGIVAQESLGVPTALRPEPGFWRRYGVNILKAAVASVSKNDDRWEQYPEIASCSFGLCQVLYATALEVGFDLQYPSDLCDPACGIEAGCKVLRTKYDLTARLAARSGLPPLQEPELTRQSLLHYNGGGDPAYAEKVLAWRRDALDLAQAREA